MAVNYLKNSGNGAFLYPVWVLSLAVPPAWHPPARLARPNLHCLAGVYSRE